MRDILFGLRSLRRAPGMAAAAIVSIALAIGVTTAIFAVVRHVLLAPLPYPDAGRLVLLWETAPEADRRWVAPANFLDWRRDLAAEVPSMAAFDAVSVSLTGAGAPERLRAVTASGSFFTTLGVQAAEGRLLTPEDDRPGAPCVAVLSAGFRSRRGVTAGVVGTTLTLDGRGCEVVGVLPQPFRFPLQPRAELWLNGDRGVPRSFPFAGDVTTVRDAHLLFVVGRLAPGVASAEVDAKLAALSRRLAAEYPDTNSGLSGRTEPLHDAVVGDVRPVLQLLQGTVLVLLLVACVNVAHLLLGRAAGRHDEMATRLALGAGRGHLVRQVLGEALAFAVPGGAAGLVLAAWALRALIAAAPEGLPRLDDVRLDGLVLGAGVALTMATSLVFGWLPALHLARVDTSPMTGSGHRVAGRHATRWSHRLLVAGELAFAQVLVAGAVLLTTSLVAVTRVDLGFATTGRLAAELSLAPDRYLRPVAGDEGRIDPTAKRQFVDDVLARLRQAPGIRAAAAAFTAPLTGAPNRGVRIEGAAEPGPGQEPHADFQVVSPDYFRTLDIALREGRVFTARDDARATPVVVVNETFARRLLGGASPLGRVVRVGGDRRHVVVGVVADTRYRRVETPAEATFYLPLAQNDERWPFLAILTATDGDGATAGPLVRAAVHAADPAQPLSTVRTLDAIFAEALAARRFQTTLVTLFGLTALLLAAIGAYGVMNGAVTSRRRELGVRAALGASAARLRGGVLGEAALVATVAALVGLALSRGGSGLLRSLVYEVAPGDARLLTASALGVVAVALLAAWLPARRAARADPVEALRGDA